MVTTHSTPLRGQTTAATVVGDVTDALNAVITDAAVSVKSLATGATREVTTNDTGYYRVYPLNPGPYEVTITKAGFRPQTIKVTLEVAQTAKLDFKLEIGQVTETVNVQAAAPVLQTQDASSGGVITSADVSRIPVNGRNYTSLIRLLPGSSDQGSSQSRGAGILSGTSLISVNGQRRQDNNLTVDGVDNNFMMMNSPGLSPPMDSLQEFRVATNNSAEYGRSAGANVNMVVRSGTRDFHGSVYEYLRNDKFDANDFFANRQGRGKVPFRQNQYGVALGGPVWLPKIYNGREKTFFFVNWEGFRRRRGSTGITTSPIADQRNGDFSQQPRPIFDPLTSRYNAQGAIERDPFAGNRIPAGRISPAVKLLLDTYLPLPNRPGLINNLINTQSQAGDRDAVVLRVDHNFNERNNIFVRYTRQLAGLTNPSSNPTFYNTSRFDGHNLALTYNKLMGTNKVLELKFGYNNPTNPDMTFGRALSRTDFLNQAGIKLYQLDVMSATTPPNFSAAGEFSIGGGGAVTEDAIYQAIANMSIIKGKHSVKFGVNYSRRHFFTNTSNPMDGNATFDPRLTNTAGIANSGHSFATMLLGLPTEIRRGQGNTLTQGRINAPQLFFQDDFRLTSRLTINLGLRYEFQNAPYDLTDRLGNLWVRRDPTTGQYSGTLLWATTNPEVDPETGLRNQPAKRLGFGRALMRSDYNNFAPRAGLAYTLTSKTVVRAAYGIFYNSTFVQELQDMRKFWPFTVQQVFTPNTGLLPDLSITDAGPSFSNTAAIGGWPQNPENRTPYSQQWNFTVQRQLLDDMSLEVGYVGNSNKKQVGYTAINSPLTPGPGPVQPRRLLPNFADLDGGANRFGSNYNSMQVTLTKRFTRGLQFNTNYTWGKALDDQSSLAEWKTQNPFNMKADYSRASIDIRHLFNLSYVYDLPFGRTRQFGAGWDRATDLLLGGWTVDGFIRAQTGRPYNVLTGSDRANVGRTYQRPNVLRNPNNGAKTPDQWFDTSAFVLPPSFSYGNAGAFIVEGDGRMSVDIAVGKRFYVMENRFLELRGEMYNMPNIVKLGDPATNFSSSSFGTITSAVDARQIQFALRFSF
ncbi:MAG: TonB-dependent receptor [Bryobacterales bacterium]|nr:TonB-dependent receptor [Bryobacterales bacterium]